MNNINKNKFIIYPSKLIKNLKDIPNNHVFPCSVLVSKAEIGGIFMMCPLQDTKYFNILPTSPIQPVLKFRMLDFNKEVYVIEIWLIFEGNPDKILKIHLNPYDSNVKKLFKRLLNN